MKYKKVFVIIDLDTKKYLNMYRADEVKTANIKEASESDSEKEAVEWFTSLQEEGYFSDVKAFKVRDYYKQIK